MECLDKLLSLSKVLLLFWNSLRDQLDVIGNTQDLALAYEELVYLAAVNLIDSNIPSFLLIIKLSLRDKCCDDVFHCAVLWD